MWFSRKQALPAPTSVPAAAVEAAGVPPAPGAAGAAVSANGQVNTAGAGAAGGGRSAATAPRPAGAAPLVQRAGARAGATSTTPTSAPTTAGKGAPRAVGSTARVTTKARGDAAEAAARAALARAGLSFIEANFRTPGRGGGEIDLVMRDRDGTLVFVEVRQRADGSHGGAGGSIGAVKQRRIVLAAQHYLMRFASPPPCRFDVVLVTGAVLASTADARGRGAGGVHIEWLKAAFDAS